MKSKIAITFSEGFFRYAQNTGFLFLEKMIRTFVTLVIWAYVIRYLGPEQFGVFSYALSFVFLFNILSDLNLDAIAVKELISDNRKNSLLGSIFFLKAMGAVLAIFLIALITFFEHFDAESRTVIFIMSLRMVFQSFGGIDYYFQSRVLSKLTVYSQILGLITTTVLCLLFVYLQKPLIYFAYVIVTEAAVIALGLVMALKKMKENISFWRIDFQIVRGLLQKAWPLVLSGVAISIYMRVDQILLKNMLGVAAVGYYSAAVRVSEVFYFIPIILMTSLFPAIVNAKLSNEDLYRDRIQVLLSVLAILALIVSAVISFSAPLLVKILFGESYMPAAPVLSLYVWANLFVFWGVVRTRLLINENLQIWPMSVKNIDESSVYWSAGMGILHSGGLGGL